MFSFSAGVRPSSDAISSQHLLAQARAHKAVENLEEAKKSYRDAVEKAQAEHEKNPGDRKVKEAFDAIHNEFFTFLRGLQEQNAATNLEEPNHTSPSFPQQNPSLPINRNDTDTHRPRSAQRAQEAEACIAALSHELVLVQTPTSTSAPTRQLQVTSPAQEKSAQVDRLFEKALSTLASLKIPNKPSLFLMYARNNPAYGVAKAEIATYFIDKLSTIRVNLYSDQTPMGSTYSSPPDDQKADGKLEDILTSQLCLLPGQLRNDVKPVDKVVVCCSDLLGKYLAWPHYEDFRQDLQKAYHQDLKQRSTSAIREVVRKYSQEKPYQAGFHHVLTEIAFLQIRAQERKDQCGIIPVSLTPESYEGCLAHFIPATAVRMEDMLRFEAQAQAGQEVYPNQGRHWVLFKLIERLLVGSDEAKTFLNKFWQGYSECISRLKSESSTTLGWREFDELVEDIFKDIRTDLHSQLAITVQQQRQQLQHQQEIALQSKQEPLAILGKNIEAEYFTAWEEPGEIQDGLAMYVAPQATTVTDTNTTFDLDEAVTAFLTAQENAGQKTQVLLLRGEAGSGKSTFDRQLARRLWRGYSATPASDERPIPLYIALPTIDRPNKNLIGQYLSDTCRFSPEQIEALRKNQRFILILDGYDEIPAEQRNLYADEKLDQWQAKIILSCRPEYLVEGYKNYLQPRGCLRLLLEYQLAPFSEQLIETYIDQYVEHMHVEWSAQQYKDTLARMPNINALLGTPFLLKMALSVLPTLDKVQSDQVGLTRIQLYEQFVRTWVERSLARLKAIQSKLTDAQQKAFCRLEDEFIGHSQVFNTDLALAMSEAKTTVAEYSAIARRGMPRDTRYEPFLSNKDEEKNLLRFSALLIRQHQQYRFIHKSIQDYLVARAVWEELENASELDASHGAEPLNEIKHVRVLWEELAPPIQVDPAALLNRFNVVEELAVQRFLVERVQQNRALVKLLLMWIKASANQDAVSRAAANSITILVRLGVQFSGMDLQRIRIPGSDLSFGVFDSAQLLGADLRNVNLTGAWLRNADLSGARMEGVQFGELPWLLLEDSVKACCYSSDGRLLIVAHGNTVTLHDTHTFEEKGRLIGHKGQVNSVVTSADGRYVVSGSDDKTVRVWDWHTPEATPSILSGHQNSVESVAVSADGRYVVSGGGMDKTVRVWDWQTSEAAPHVLSGNEIWVSSVAVSADGRYVVSGSWDKMVLVWDGQTPEAAPRVLSGHGGQVTSVVISADGRYVVSGSDDKTVRVWDWQTPEAAPCVLRGHEASITSVEMSADGRYVVSGSFDKTVRVWDWQTPEAAPRVLSGYQNSVESVVMSADGRYVVSGSDDKTVRVWDWQTPEAAPSVFSGHEDQLTSLVMSADGRYVVSGSLDKTVRVWDWQTPEAVPRILSGHEGWVKSVVMSADGRYVVSGSWDCTVRVWDWQTLEATPRILRGHQNSVESVVMSADGRYVVSGSEDNTVRVWDWQTPEAAPRVLSGHEGWVTSVVMSADGRYVASGSFDKTVRVWDWHTPEAAPRVLRGHEHFVTSVVMSVDGRYVVSRIFGNTVRVWDWQTPEAAPRVLSGHEGWVTSVVMSADGRYVVSGSKDKTVRVWDWQTLEATPRILRGHQNSVESVVMSADGRYVASGSKDKTVRLWDIASGKCLATIHGFNGGVNRVAWQNIDGLDYLITGSYDKIVRCWQWIPADDQWHVRLRWTSGQNALTLVGAKIDGVEELSPMNSRLLKQRGATGEPRKTVEEESLPLPIEGAQSSVLTLAAQADSRFRSTYLNFV